MPGPYFPDPAAEAIRDPAFTESSSLDSAGNVLERLAYLIANPPVGPSYYNTVDVEVASTRALLVPVQWWAVALGSSDTIGNSSSVPSATSMTKVWDSTRKKPYFRNNTGLQAHLFNCTIFGFPYSQTGLTRDVFDFNNIAWETLLPPAGLTKFVMEFDFTWVTALATDNETGIGISNVSAVSTPFDAARRSVGFFRKSGAVGWTLITTNGTTRTETAEASDTSNNSNHIARIEWDGTAGSATLYIDGVQKCTTTATMPSLTDLTPLTAGCGLTVDTAAASDSVRIYSCIAYWK